MTREEYLSTAHQSARRGDSHPGAKLDTELAQLVRANLLGYPRWLLSVIFGVHVWPIEHAISGESWGHEQ